MIRKALYVLLICAAAPVAGLAQESSDDELARCRSIGLEGFIQNIVGQNVVVTGTILAFCDDYRKLFERSQQNEATLRETSQTLTNATRALGVATSQLNALQIEVKSLKDRLPPDDAILIVDDGDGCPTGWIDIAAREPQIFAGRTIVARGFHSDRDPRDYRDTGGEETHTLSEGEMPVHNHGGETTDNLGAVWHAEEDHTFFTRDVATRDVGFSVKQRHKHRIDRSGGSTAHNNMPPYVALYFCKLE